MEHCITLKNVSVELEKKKLLADISTEISAGEVVGLLGPSGAGKTTLMRVVMGLQSYQGETSVLGMKPGSAQLQTQIGYVTQAPSVYSDLTVAENLRYFGGLLNLPHEEIRAVIEKVGLSSHTSQLVEKLSGGEKSRVSLAIALLGKPKLLILDEPTVGLDPLLRQELWRLFKDLAKTGVALLVSSHVMDEAEHCDRLLLLREGKLLADNSPAHLKQHLGVANIEEAFLKLVHA